MENTPRAPITGPFTSNEKEKKVRKATVTNKQVITDESKIETQITNPFGSELVWKTYLTLTEKEKLEFAVFILGKGEAHEE